MVKPRQEALEAAFKAARCGTDNGHKTRITRIVTAAFDATDLVERFAPEEVQALCKKFHRSEVIVKLVTIERDEARREAEKHYAAYEKEQAYRVRAQDEVEKQGKQIAALQEAAENAMTEIEFRIDGNTGAPFIALTITGELGYGHSHLDKVLTDTEAAASEWQRVPEGWVVVPEELQAALQAQHDWHLTQTDEDQWGVIPAEAYDESGLSDRTVSALEKAKYATFPKASERPEAET